MLGLGPVLVRAILLVFLLSSRLGSISVALLYRLLGRPRYCRDPYSLLSQD